MITLGPLTINDLSILYHKTKQIAERQAKRKGMNEHGMRILHSVLFCKEIMKLPREELERLLSGTHEMEGTGREH